MTYERAPSLLAEWGTMARKMRAVETARRTPNEQLSCGCGSTLASLMCLLAALIGGSVSVGRCEGNRDHAGRGSQIRVSGFDNRGEDADAAASLGGCARRALGVG